VAELFSRVAAALAGRYRVDREIGTGATAIVYLAHDLRHNRKVALKVLRPEVSASVGAARFLREIEVTASLQHPNILPLYDSGEADSLLFYVMPWIEGESLRHRLDRELQLSVEDAVGIAQSVAAALDFAHERGVVHRDIKPENILLQAGQALVADFGIALAIRTAADQRMTEAGVSPGTLRYMSPEQVRGERELDHRSDIYSLGVVVYEMLTGETPFTGNSMQTLLARLLTEEPIPIRRIRPPVPEYVDRAVLRALARSPADRFPNVETFAGVLSPGGGSGGAERWVRRGPARRAGRLVWIALAVLPVLAVSLLPGLFDDGDPATVRSLAVLPLSNLARDSTREYFVQGIQGALITELSKVTGRSSLETVISHTSALRMRDRQLTVPEMGAALAVDALLEGEVLQTGDRVRIDVRLVQVAPERLLWADSYEGDLSDVLALQRRVTADIAGQIALALTPAQRAYLADAPEVDPGANDLYMRARYVLNLRTPDGFRRAVDYFRQSLDLDPEFAPAWAGLSDSYNLIAQYRQMPFDQALELARSAADRAIDLDSTLAEAYTARAEIHFLEREWDAADRMYRTALDLNPSSATGHHYYGWFLTHMGRNEEAIGELERAHTLDPLSSIIGADLADAYINARRYDEADTTIRSTLEFDPDFDRAKRVRLNLAILTGTVRHEYPEDRPLPDLGSDLVLAQLVAALGQRTKADSLIRVEVRAAQGDDNLGPYAAALIATVHVLLEEYDTALDWLERAVDDGLAAGPIVLTGPLFDPVRSEPRYISLMDRLGIRP
jgi:TolB-like protein/tRNA A-37 threonylcarbamoyl transferase component Bud32